MTMPRPLPPSGLISKALDSLSIKTCLAAVLSVTAWHYIDAGDIKTLKEHNADQDRRLNVQSTILQKKLDQETYEREQLQLHTDIQYIRESEDQIKQILMERNRTEAQP